jgi:NADH-quinone oxidoreductase subunit L
MNLLWLIPTLPFLGFTILVLSSGRMSRERARMVGVGSVVLAFLTTIYIATEYYAAAHTGAHGGGFTVSLWPWIMAGDLNLNFSLYLDGLSLSMLFVITGVGSLIHLYASGYMWDDPDYTRFFTYMNLFVAAMLMLVLADNLVLMFLGWEGVGLCSFLLIGFWYKDRENGYAARKAFVVTRVGDTAFAIGLFLLFRELGTLEIQEILHLAPEHFEMGANMPTLISALLLGGAAGKSAQIPFQTWLPDAMAGPTPVSALIHAATMVTAGVYLIARCHPVFLLSPTVMTMVASVGLITLLVAGFTALNQWDIKRVLAYSTMSQIGYMFLALGVEAWDSSIFHLMTHAVFKALLFLTAGSIILALHHEQDIRKMGGLRKQLPVPFWCFLIGSACLIALPPTSGFWSKEPILLAAWEANPIFWVGAVLGAFLTAVYTTRLMIMVFFGHPEGGPPKTDEPKGWQLHPPLLILAGLSLVAGMVNLPAADVLPHAHEHHPPLWVEIIGIVLPLVGIFIGYQVFQKNQWQALRFASFDKLRKFFASGWGFDWLYDKVLVKPFLGLAAANRNDIIDLIPKGVVTASSQCYYFFSRGQNGQLRFYVATMAAAAIMVISLALFT